MKIAKFNSFYYYGLIREITNKERYAQQSHQTNDNEYHKKRGKSVNTQFQHFHLMQPSYAHTFGYRHHANGIFFSFCFCHCHHFCCFVFIWIFAPEKNYTRKKKSIAFHLYGKHFFLGKIFQLAYHFGTWCHHSDACMCPLDWLYSQIIFFWSQYRE